MVTFIQTTFGFAVRLLEMADVVSGSGVQMVDGGFVCADWGQHRRIKKVARGLAGDVREKQVTEWRK
jgi:hypothetical protein